MVWEFRVCCASLRLFGRGCVLRVSGFQREFFRGRKKRDLAENTGDRALRLSGFFSFFQVSAFGLVRFCSDVAEHRSDDLAPGSDWSAGFPETELAERLSGAWRLAPGLLRACVLMVSGFGLAGVMRRRDWESMAGRIRRLTGRPRS